MFLTSLVIVNYFNIEKIFSGYFEANSVLLVYANTVLALSIST